ncbi:MAG: thiamine phosphate synthase [Rubricella sp.]
MTEDHPQLYLVSPQRFEIDAFADDLARVLDARPVACLRLILPGDDEGEARRAADRLRGVAHARDVAVVVSDTWKLVEPHGLDGVHLTDGPRRMREVRKALGPDRIVGAFCGATRHAGMVAGEIGADYVSFGPVSEDAALGGEEIAPAELFEWWAQMIEVPLVAEGGFDPAIIEALSPHLDFIALGREIWSHPEGALAAISGLIPS